MPDLILIRDEPRPYATCPSCDVRLDLPSLAGQRWTIRSAGDVAGRLTIEMAGLEQEELRVVLLSTRNLVLQVVTIVRGTLNSAHVRVGEIFREAIRMNAAGLILVHNHSGEPNPSPDDLHLTAEVLAAGRLLDIDLLDHIIVSPNDGWTSLRDRGVAFDRPNRP